MDLASNATPEFDVLDERDRRLAYELLVGTVQRQGTLDVVLARVSSAPLSRVDGDVRATLRLGAYQLLYMDRLPAHAVVSDGVELVKRRGARTTSFVNAVLRRLATEGPALLSSLTTGDDARSLALRYAYPRWLVELWLAEMGRATTVALLVAGDEPPERCLRVNALRATPAQARASLAAHAIGSATVPGFPDALVVDGPPVERSAAVRDGLVTPQSRASQLVARVAAAHLPSAGRAIDLCAAPGVKSAHLAALLPGWRLTVVDDDPERVEQMRVNLARLGAPADVLAADVLDLDVRELGAFDLVVLDAPCTGLGTLASRPDLRWRRRAAHVQRLAALQQRLLAAAGSLVGETGVLVYSVCTLTRAETLAVVDALLAKGGWQLDDLGVEHPRFAHPRNGATLLTLPSRDRTSGFFIARLRRMT